MAIPPHLIETPEIVWATLDDTVDQVRQRLEAPRIKNKWRAFVIARSVDSRFAATAVFDIQPLVWQEGPAAMKHRLRDLGLFHLHAGIEQDSIDEVEALALAGKNDGYLVVLSGGGYTGIVRGPGIDNYDSQPPGTFDLFDQPLTKDHLPQVEFILAAPDTTIADVAEALRPLKDPESAYIVIEMDDDSYRVMLASDLNREISDADRSIWRTTLSDFARLLRRAASREMETLGLDQAQSLAEDYHFLVVIQEGEPIGIMRRSAFDRLEETEEAAALDIEDIAAHDLFDVPRSFLDDLDAPPQPEQKPRFVNIWFKDSQDEIVNHSQALLLGNTYYLALNVGKLLEHSIIDWKRTPKGPLAAAEPQEIITPQEETYLYVSVHSQDFDIAEPTIPLWLPAEDDTETVHVRVQPLHRSLGDSPARLDVNLYYRTHLVQTFTVYAEVVVSEQAAQSDLPQVAELTHARTKSFPAMQELAPRQLSLTISRDSADRYRFTFLVDADPQDKDAAEKAIELSCLVRLTRDDLTHLITKARRQLYNVVQIFSSLQEGDDRTTQRALRALAQVGRQLYLRLFDSRSARALADWIESSLPDGSTIQVVDLAGDFVFPWSLVYSAQPWDTDEPVDVARFWGWRFQLVVLTQQLLDTYRQAETEIATGEPLRVSVGMYERLKGIREQKAFFKALAEQSNQRIEPEILTSRRKMSQALTDADRHTYYFFCHGYTERIATDIQLDADLVGHFARIAAARRGAKPKSLTDHLDDLFDVSDSWLRLTRGKIPLTMLKELVPAEFSQHPVVFLNMCESAQVLPSLSDGFVPFFIKRGARAIIGTECSMNTIFADDFARKFLTCFFQGEAAGEILWALRRHYLNQGNPLALAYTLYGDADLHLEESVLTGGDGEALSPCILRTARETTERGGQMSQDTRLEAVDILWDDDMDGLMLTLASRADAEEKGLVTDELQSWTPDEAAFATDEEAGPEWTSMMKALGETWWAKLEPRLYDLLCKEGQENDELMDALTQGAKLLAVALAPVLVAQIAALPAVAIVIATIAAKKIADAGLEAVCELWKESLEGGEETE